MKSKESTTHTHTKSVRIRLAKEESSFLYFILESNEGLCFYSTLDHHRAQPYREIDISFHPSLEQQFQSMLGHLAKTIEFQINSIV